MQDFSTEFFILWEVLAGSYLVSMSLTLLCLLTTGITYLLAYMSHFVIIIMHFCRLTLYIYYDPTLI